MAYRPLIAENQRHTNDAKWGWSERMVLFELPAEKLELNYNKLACSSDGRA